MTRYADARISNPIRYFQTPRGVLEDDRLSHDEKEKVLKSMAVDAEQMIDATAEGMKAPAAGFNAKDLQSALTQLQQLHTPAPRTGDLAARFRRIVVVTTVNQDLNREIAEVAFDLAGISGGKVSLLGVVPPTLEGTALAAAAPMASAVAPVGVEDAQVIENRKAQLSELLTNIDSQVETGIEVRSGQVEGSIVEFASDCSADLIVVGAPNRSWLETLFNPSIASGITKSAPCPVLVVPEPG